MKNLDKSKSIYTKIAFESIQHFLNYRNTDALFEQVIPDALLVQKACFVTLHVAKNGYLRGCIGTLEPVYEHLFSEIVHNAVAAATRDTRFEPLTLAELQTIDISVDVLTKPKKQTDLSNHNPKTHGLIISDGLYRRGVLLPDLEGIDSAEQQISIVKRKAGIAAYETNLEYFTFQVERFY